MNPDRMADLVRRWVQLYTHGLPAEIAERRIDEVAADLHDHITAARADGTGEWRITAGIASRMIRGIPADAVWREAVLTRHPWSHHEAEARSRTSYRRAVGTAAGAVLILVWMIGALGIIGDAGDRADRLYLGVLAVGFVGALWARLRAAGMARTLAAMAVAQASIGLFAIAAGLVPAYNTPFEILALNGLFALLFAVAAGLFRRADKQRADPRRS